MKLRPTIVIVDLFCGAGGLSEGAKRAAEELGFRVKLICVNHWPVAIKTHGINHPDAIHFCQNIATVRPLVAVPGGRVDLLIAAPTCTYYSRARGGRPVSDQQRMDPWHIIPWLTELSVGALLVENVPEIVKWGPVNQRTGKPIKAREGEYFNAWIAALRGCGMDLEFRFPNAADFGDATTRQRFIMFGVNRRRGRVADAWSLVNPTHAPEEIAAKMGLKPWRPAADIIDWSIKGTSIYNRPKALAPSTIKRIYAGLVKFGWPEPYIARLRNYMRVRGIELPTVAVSEEPGSAQPFMLSRHAGGAPRSTRAPTPAQVAKHSHMLFEPASPQPLISSYYGSGSGKTCQTTRKPLPTQSTVARFGLVIPITHSSSVRPGRPIQKPLYAITTAKRGELAFISASFGERKGQSARVRSLRKPVPAILAQGRTNLVEPGNEHDIFYRMFETHELAAAMSLHRNGQPYQFAGKKTQVIKQIGNAVPAEMGKAHVKALLQVLRPKKIGDRRSPSQLRRAA